MTFHENCGLKKSGLSAALMVVLCLVVPRSAPAQVDDPPALPDAPGAEEQPGDASASDPGEGLPPEEKDNGFAEMELLAEVMELIRQGYVDPDKTTYDKLVNSALEGMLSHLDPHSQFMQPQVFEQLQRHTDSTYEGIGVTISTKNESLTIVTAREDGPAARAGVLPGDQILKINNHLTEDVGLSEAVAMLRGRPGEKLDLTVRRPATRKLHEFSLVREIIKQSTVKDVRILDEKATAPYRMGYARILQFSEPTAEELADGLDKLERQGIDAFVLDMRNNPGGLLPSAIDVCGEFVDAGTVVLTTEGRPGSGEIKVFRTSARAKRRDRDYPLAILVNHSSASGAEVVAGALQDLKRCIVVGETTFGKGSVQSVLPIGDGKAIRLTTAKYYTPSHRTIHENGVIPNIVAPLTPAQEEQVARWFSRDTLPENERKQIADYLDPQLERAIDAMKGALVYSDIESGNTVGGDDDTAGADDDKATEEKDGVGEKDGAGEKDDAEEDGKTERSGEPSQSDRSGDESAEEEPE